MTRVLQCYSQYLDFTDLIHTCCNSAVNSELLVCLHSRATLIRILRVENRFVIVGVLTKLNHLQCCWGWHTVTALCTCDLELVVAMSPATQAWIINRLWWLSVGALSYWAGGTHVSIWDLNPQIVVWIIAHVLKNHAYQVSSYGMHFKRHWGKSCLSFFVLGKNQFSGSLFGLVDAFRQQNRTPLYCWDDRI